MFRSHTQLLGTPWPHRRLRRSAAVRRDASSSPSLWSAHSWTDTCLFQLHLSSMMDTFQGLLEIPCFHPSDFCGAKKKRKKEPGRPAAPRKTNTPIQTTLRDRQSKFFDAQLIPPDERVISLQECRRTRVIFYSERRLRSTQDALWLRHNRALHCCNHVYVL